MTPDSKSVLARFIRAVLRSWFEYILMIVLCSGPNFMTLILIQRIGRAPSVSLLSREETQDPLFQAPGCGNLCTFVIKSLNPYDHNPYRFVHIGYQTLLLQKWNWSHLVINRVHCQSDSLVFRKKDLTSIDSSQSSLILMKSSRVTDFSDLWE